MHTDIHALSGIRTHDPNLLAAEDSSCLRPLAHCARLIANSGPKLQNYCETMFDNFQKVTYEMSFTAENPGISLMNNDKGSARV
jgi:hypothetical protein